MILSKKAFLMVCLFFSYPTKAGAQEFSLTGNQTTAYAYILNFFPDNARQMLVNDPSAEARYLLSLADCMELLLSEDPEKFAAYEKRFDERLDKTTGNTALPIFVRAEIHLQQSFVYLKFGHELDAALQLRKAYLLSRQVRDQHPRFKAGLKTSGLLNVMIGSIPEKYYWILDILNMEGDVERGLRELKDLAEADHALSAEASLLWAFINGFVLQNPEAGIVAMEATLPTAKNNAALFLNANLHLKNSNGEKALQNILEVERSLGNNMLPYLNYLKGELMLYKGEYGDSRRSFKSFLSAYRGQNFIKDAHFKIGICHLLEGNEKEARKAFDIARHTGKESTEADKYAARSLADEALPNITLTKVRYLTDGGYYDNALALLNNFDVSKLRNSKDQIEYPYRKARLHHKRGERATAITFYKKTIDINADAEYYFAPNACLQLGYLYVESGDRDQATMYFKKALSYKRHEYKNSIDSKAKSSLNHLSDRK